MENMAKTGKRDSERGNAPVEFVLIFPVLLVMFFGIIQGAMWYQGQNIAHAAASAAYNNSRASNGTSGSGVTAGNQVINQHPGSLNGVSVSVDKNANEVSATVTGHASTFIPGWNGPTITQTVSGPTERWVNR